MRAPVLVLVVVAGLVAGGGACDPPLSAVPFEPAGPAAAPDPSTLGPFPVGVRTVALVDDTRTTEGFDHPRTLVTEIWYPADESARGGEGVDYVIYDELPAKTRAGLTREDLGRLDTVAVRDALPRADRGPFPLVVFSHGKGGIRMQSTYFTVLLASHGYVVAAPDHEGDTIIDLLEDGDVDMTSTVGPFVDRPIDVSFLIERFTTLDDDDPLAGMIDPDRIGVAGHSFGALTSFISAGNDWRVRAIVGQTPVGVGLVEIGSETKVRDMGIPMMIQAAGLDRTLPADLHATSLWENMQPPRYSLTLATGGHFTYSDLCVLDVAAIDAALDIDASNVLTDGCGEENIAPADAFPVIDLTAIGFFNLYLRGSAGSAEHLTQAAGERLAGDEVVFVADP
jgi:predicted dienelactone hydrolase